MPLPLPSPPLLLLLLLLIEQSLRPVPIVARHGTARHDTMQCSRVLHKLKNVYRFDRRNIIIKITIITIMW